jgi:hypothetical protein
MTKSAQSVFYFGIYLLLTGVTLLFMPNLLLGMCGLPATEEVWIRVVGMLAGIIGVYYVFAARQNLTPFFRMTVYIRSTVILFFGAFVLAGLVKPALLLFGAIDLAGAIWTQLALKNSR